MDFLVSPASGGWRKNIRDAWTNCIARDLPVGYREGLSAKKQNKEDGRKKAAPLRADGFPWNRRLDFLRGCPPGASEE